MSYPPPYGGGYPPTGPGYPPAGGGMPVPQAAPAGLPYHPQPYGPGQSQPYGAPQPGYPAAGGGMPQPDFNQPAGGPGGMPYPGAPSQPPYPGAPSQPPYPGAPSQPSYPGVPSQPAYPGVAAPYPSSSPYPAGMPSQSSYPPSQPQSAPYPAGGAAPPGQPLPSQPPQSGSSPYPSSAPTGPSVSSYPAAPTPNSGGPPQAASRPPSQPPKSASGGGTSQSKSTDADSTYYYTCAKSPGDSGTITPLKTSFNPETDATQLRNCLKSITVNETVIVNILPHRSNAQRQEIRKYYKTMFGKDLLEDSRAALSGDFESVALALMMTPVEYDAYLIKKAIEGAGTDEDVLIEILCTRTNAQINKLAETYKQTYRKSIESDIKGDTSGHFRRMLVSLANGARQEDQGVNLQKAEEDAKKLHKAGAARLGTDESAFNAVFVSQSFEQLRAVFTAYQRLYKKDMEKVIKSEMSGDLESGMKAITRFTMDKHAYFANLLYKAMKGLGTDEKALIRTLVTRSEIDLLQIKQAFLNIKGESKPLKHWIKKETSGPFRDMLLHIIGDAQ